MNNGTATILSYKPEHVIIQTESTRSASLILTDTYYPGWQAHIDGNPATIIRTNWTMRGVVVPAGKHTVTMTYKPKRCHIWRNIEYDKYSRDNYRSRYGYP